MSLTSSKLVKRSVSAAVVRSRTTASQSSVYAFANTQVCVLGKITRASPSPRARTSGSPETFRSRYVRDAGSGAALRDRRVLLHRPRCIDEHEVGPRVRVCVAPRDRVIETGHLKRIRPRDDQGLVRASSLHGCAHFQRHLRRRDDLFAFHVPASLRGDLVLDLDRVCACRLELPGRQPGTRLGAVPRVGVDDDRQLCRGAHAPDALDDLGTADEADVGQAEMVGGEGIATVVDRLDPGALGESGREPVVSAERDESVRLRQAGAETGCHAGTTSCSG